MAFISIKALWKRRHDRKRDRLADNSANRFPIEIIEIIIDLLHDDDSFWLSICSLVCKAWLAVCRDHRFFRIALAQINFKGFIRLLRSSQFNAHIHSQTRGILLVQSDRRWLRSLIPHMGRFSATHLCIDLKSTPDLPPLVTSFQSVTNLELVRPLLHTIAQFVDVVCGLGNLERLVLFNARFDSVKYPLKALTYGEQRFPQKLQEFRLTNYKYDDGKALFHWLKGCKPALAPMHTLGFYILRASSDGKDFFWTDAREILSKFGSLKYLMISSFGLTTTDVLSHNHALLSLHLARIDLHVAVRKNPSSWDWVPELLSQVVSPCIQTVVFEININNVDELEVLDWERIARSLSRPQFSQLRHIFFMVSELGTEVERRIREKLPECWERDIIQFCRLCRRFGKVGDDFHFYTRKTRTRDNSFDILAHVRTRRCNCD